VKNRYKPYSDFSFAYTARMCLRDAWNWPSSL